MITAKKARKLADETRVRNLKKEKKKKKAKAKHLKKEKKKVKAKIKKAIKESRTSHTFKFEISEDIAIKLLNQGFKLFYDFDRHLTIVRW